MAEESQDMKSRAKEKLDGLAEQSRDTLESAKAAGKEKFGQAKEKAEEFADRFKEQQG